MSMGRRSHSRGWGRRAWKPISQKITPNLRKAGSRGRRRNPERPSLATQMCAMCQKPLGGTCAGTHTHTHATSVDHGGCAGVGAARHAVPDLDRHDYVREVVDRAPAVRGLERLGPESRPTAGPKSTAGGTHSTTRPLESRQGTPQHAAWSPHHLRSVQHNNAGGPTVGNGRWSIF